MRIDTLSLTDFRNYESLELHPSDGVNVLIGPNAQGKSAVIEAVYMLATSKSHRTNRDADTIRIGTSFARACAEVDRSARNEVSVEIVISKTEKKSVKIDKVKHPKIGDLVGQLNAVVFSSLDIDMVRGEPSLRRRFLNLEISQTSPQYVYSLGRFRRVLEQRNELLKEIKVSGASTSGLDVWDSQLASYGAAVTAKREEFVRFLSESAARIYSVLTNDSEQLAVAYKSSMNGGGETDAEIAERYAQTLAARREQDIARGITSVGPHRDDLSLGIGGVSVREFASQGQQRSVAVALKLAEIELMEQAAGEAPVLLLDDVTAELDDSRRAKVFELTRGRCQTFVTTTRLAELDPQVAATSTVFEVRSGKVTRA